MMGIKDRPDSRGSDLDIDDSRSDRDSNDIHDREHDDRDREPIRHVSSERPPMPKLKMGALDIANMIAKHKPRSTSPVDGAAEHRTSIAEISPLSTGVKPLDLSHYSRLPGMPGMPGMPPGFKGGFYPYPGVSLPPTMSAYPYTPAEAVSISAAGAPHGTQSLPLYSYPLAESTGTPSMSTLRLSALLASRKRRQGGSTSGESHDLDLDVDDKMASGDASSRKKVRPVPEEKKDGAYWERRRKNNDAAKRSRDARRMKEEEIALRAVFLEQENMKLRAECSILKSELGRLHFMVYNC